MSACMALIELVRDALGHYEFVGVRGLPHRDASKKYRKNQILTRSYTHYDEGPEEMLDGTSAVHIIYEMSDERILEAISTAREQYSDTGKVILVVGSGYDMGIDHGEIIISNNINYETRGARFIAYL